jgi:hypothetical protein
MVRGARQRDGGVKRKLERAAGFEPATTGLEGQRYYQLSYARSGCRLRASLERSKSMAVRADNIALGGLRQHARDAAVDHACDVLDLRRWISMVEIHRALCEPTATVRARDGAHLIQKISSVTPSSALTIDPGRDRRTPRREPSPVLSARAKSMAVGADDVALCCFLEKLLATLECGSTGAQRE